MDANECFQTSIAVQTFSSRGLLSKILFASVDLKRLQSIDESLTGIVHDMGLALQVETVILQRVLYDEVATANKDVVDSIVSLGGIEVGRGRDLPRPRAPHTHPHTHPISRWSP